MTCTQLWLHKVLVSTPNMNSHKQGACYALCLNSMSKDCTSLRSSTSPRTFTQDLSLLSGSCSCKQLLEARACLSCRVLVRLRPTAEGSPCSIATSSATSLAYSGSAEGSGSIFSFVRVFPAAAEQEAVFSEVKHIVNAALSGSHGTIMSYGQVASVWRAISRQVFVVAIITASVNGSQRMSANSDGGTDSTQHIIPSALHTANIYNCPRT